MSAAMEILVIICLLIVIILLLKDKVVIRKPMCRQERMESEISEMADIMGMPKKIERRTTPISATKRQTKVPDNKPDSFETETVEKDFAGEIPQEELDEVFVSGPDLEEEEEEWNRYGTPNGDEGFASGVTFDELGTVEALLQQETLEPAAEQQAIDVVRRMQGTELFALLENSMAGASGRIAALLDRSLSSGTDSSSFNLWKSGLDGFDIGEFV